MADFIFCKIINKEIPAKIIAENDDVLVVQDISPKAPIHYLIIPKKHMHDLAALEHQDKAIAGSLLLMARDLSKSLSGSQSFRLIANTGSDVGQSVFHAHLHFLSGKKYSDFLLSSFLFY